jgi:SAM-dependent methyltransferase
MSQRPVPIRAREPPGSAQEVPPTEEVGRCPACGCPDRNEVCRSRDWIHLIPGEFPLMECTRCRATYPDPRPTRDGLAAYYPPSAYYAYARPGRHLLFARTDLPARMWYLVSRGILSHRYGYPFDGSRVAATARWLPGVLGRATFGLGVLLHPWLRDGALLDVGCGSGRYLDLMRALGWSRTVGVDVSETAIERAREIDLEAYAGQLSEVGFPESTFDAVSLSHTLEHVADPVGLLTEVRRISKPGGRIVILVPHVVGLGARVFREHWVGLETPRHLVNYSREALSRVLLEAGLDTVQLTTSPHGARRTLLFSLSRRRGDPHSTYIDDRHRFGVHRHAQATSLAVLEYLMCRLGRPAGELLVATAKA